MASPSVSFGSLNCWPTQCAYAGVGFALADVRPQALRASVTAAECTPRNLNCFEVVVTTLARSLSHCSNLYIIVDPLHLSWSQVVGQHSPLDTAGIPRYLL